MKQTQTLSYPLVQTYNLCTFINNFVHVFNCPSIKTICNLLIINNFTDFITSWFIFTQEPIYFFSMVITLNLNIFFNFKEANSLMLYTKLCSVWTGNVADIAWNTQQEFYISLAPFELFRVHTMSSVYHQHPSVTSQTGFFPSLRIIISIQHSFCFFQTYSLYIN